MPSNIPRRTFLKGSTGALASVVASQCLVTRESVAETLEKKKNFLLLITDQERPPMWFPPGWEEANLPNTQRLKAHGLSFSHAFTAAAMCTPSRNCMFTGLYAPQHGSEWTLTEDTDQAFEEHQLDPSLPNLATCLKEAGYDVLYKGKWHMSKRVRNADGESFTEDNISRYGFDGWDPPDAGGDAKVINFGGADAPRTVHHDQRFIDDAVAFLRQRLASSNDKPFCLIVSLINPHDVLSYPNRYADAEGNAFPGGYKDGYGDADPWIEPTEPPIELPPTVDEKLLLKQKPFAQTVTLAGIALNLGPLPTPQQKTDYVNFYGRLMMAVDTQIGQLLDVLDPEGDGAGEAFKDTIVIRTSDHGEMAMSHGGLRQKAFVAYEEVLRVPLIWSNPELFPEPKTTSAMVSNVDLLPTLCALTGVEGNDFKGIDYSHVILDPEANDSSTAVRDHVVFTFDDIYSAGDRGKLGEEGGVDPPNRLQVIRTADFKLVRYYDAKGVEPDVGEFYDLTSNGGDYYPNDGADGTIVYHEPGPLEMKNLYDTPDLLLTAEQRAARVELKTLLESAQSTTLLPRDLPSSNSGIRTRPELRVVGRDTGLDAQITFVSQAGRTYQLQRSTDLVDWENVPHVICGEEGGEPLVDPDQPIQGNNGPIALCDLVTEPPAFYRIVESDASVQSPS